MRNFVTPRNKLYDNERLTRKQKEFNDFQWYREKIDSFDSQSDIYNTTGYGGVSEYKRMKVNYDLFNNIIDLSDFAYVCTPFGAEQGELPANMVNRDISSYRIKALIGMEMRRPFGYRVMATNHDATQRKEEEETSKIKEFVVSQIMAPIQHEIELKYQEQLKGKLTPQQKQQIQQQMQAEITAKTPPEVRKYMLRDHQDPSEVQGQQITNYNIKKQDIRRKFNLGWKHALLSAYEIYWMGIVRGEPTLKVVNPLRFSCDKSTDNIFIEDGEWAVAEYMMHPSEVAQMFELTDDELDKVYKNQQSYAAQRAWDSMFTEDEYINTEDANCCRVIHVVFKGLRKIGWLDYIDEDGILQKKMLVDENYVVDRAAGDIRIKWEWVPEVYEGYRINADIYKNMQPVEGQFRDMDEIYTCKLPYYGSIYDNTNSQPTAPMDRMKTYQYFHNILWYRLELLLASDKGKKILMNINAIPSEAGIDMEKWQYYFESTPFMWYNPDEEGMSQSDVNTIAKQIDMSVVSDIKKYVDLLEYLDQKCGKCIGVTDPVLGETAVSERVGNNQQNLVQTSHMLEPYFDMHNLIKRNVLQGLLDLSKVAYTNSDKKYLTYIMDDMSQAIFKLDINLLKSSTLSLFMEDSSMSEEIKQTIGQLAHAAMQNQKIELSDVLKVIRQDSIQEAEESLLVAEEMRQEKEQAIQDKQNQFESEEAQKGRDHEKEVWAEQRGQIVLKETERRKTEIQKQTILSLGFNEDKDLDDDGTPDVLEVAKFGVEASIEAAREARENRALDHKIEDDKDKNKIARMAKKKSISN